MAKDIPEFGYDIFTPDAVRNARAVDDEVREFAPAVRLHDGVVMIARHEHVTSGLLDWKSFSSASRPWHDPNSPRPEILLTDDPPRHTQVRKVVQDALSPRALEGAKATFQKSAEEFVERLRTREGEPVDAVGEITQAWIFEVLPEVLGLPREGRHHMHGFSQMVWATMGPPGELFDEAMSHDYSAVIEWLGTACDRDALSPDGIGQSIFAAADNGQVTMDEAKLLLQTILSAGADTTYLTMANAIRAWAMFPDQYAKLRANPKLLRNAFDESLRWDSPSRMAGRIATRDVEIDDYVVPAGTRCGLMFAAANRDPRFWSDPEAYDIERDTKHSLGWGYGVHGCVGRMLAQTEAQAFLGTIVREVESFELAGEYEPWMTTVGHGPIKLPVKLNFA
ncbi:cytochrome P450 [Alteraurantiacibacter aquimixticola]|uniref:Cytochrome P450 n=1 Tax=Alteraurantiacibacter aquimixticola TaxID=2489173 RepID=A0A4V4U898_9SPHN|nr:cytochrome P450 [Alteraurantiacibacter aquimixticola]TIX49027.1 cytochrome P450 [Alteraurantiacibacter aquimixticola]